MLGAIRTGERAGEAARFVMPSPVLAPIERLDIYGRGYRAKIVSAFRTMFPALRRAAGDELLDAFALDYVDSNPPSSFTINDVANGFPAHLSATRPDSDETWPDFLIELAALELAILDVAEGPGIEGKSLPDARAPIALPTPLLAKLRPVPSPSLRVFATSWPVQEYVRAVRAERAPELPKKARSWFAIVRQSYRVMIHDLGSAEHALLETLDGNVSVGEIEIEEGFVRGRLCEWAARGFFSSLQ